MGQHEENQKNGIPHLSIRLNYFLPIATSAVVISSVSRASAYLSLRDGVAQLIIQISGMAIVFIFWLSVAKTLHYFAKGKLTLLQISTIGALGGLLMACTQNFMSWVFQIDLIYEFSAQVISNTLLAAFWLPIISLIVENFDRYKAERIRIRENFLRQESVQFARRLALDEYRKKIEGEIQGKLIITTAAAQNFFKQVKDNNSHEIPGQLRSISKNYFRLNAHQINGAKTVETRGALQFLKSPSALHDAFFTSVSTKPLNPLLFSLVIMATILLPITAKSNIFITAQILLATGLCCYFTQKLLGIAMKKVQSVPVQLTGLATSLNIFFSIAISHAIPDNNVKAGNSVGFIIVIIIATLLGHIIQAGILNEKDLRARSINSLNKLKSDQKVQNDIFVQITRDWAKYIHGTYTSKLEATALALEVAIAKKDFDAIEEAIKQVEIILKFDDLKASSRPRILIEEIKERCINWEGLIDIKIEGSPQSESSVAVSTRSVGDCVEEALLNAVRHGNCAVVKIEIFDNQTCFSMIITDDGKGFVGNPKGFGSSIYEEATSGDWKLWRNEKEKFTVLELSFAKSKSLAPAI